jgi:hypothetical protein
MTTGFSCTSPWATVEYEHAFVMLTLSTQSARRLVRVVIAILAVAVVLVPTIKRAQQHVEHRDATRLSIKHSWIGVAPPTKAHVAPQPIAILPALAADPEPARVVRGRPVVADPAPHPVFDFSPDPLRGPPSAFRS